MLTPTGTWCEDAWLVTVGADPRDPEPQVPGRLPARRHLAHAVGADGRRLPADLERPAAAQRGDRRRADRAEAVRRPPRPRLALRPHRRVPLRRARHLDAARRSTSTASTTRSRAPRSAARSTRCRTSTSAGRPHRPVRWRPSTPTSTSPGASRRSRSRRRSRWIRGLAAEQGRDVRFGLRIHTLSRDTSEQAWQQAQWLLDGLDPATIEKAQAALAASESVGQQRMRVAARRAHVVRVRARPGDHAEPVVGRRARPRRCRHRARRQPPGGGRPARGVPPDRHRRVHPVRLPARRGGVLVRRGRDAGPAGQGDLRRRRRSSGGCARPDRLRGMDGMRRARAAAARRTPRAAGRSTTVLPRRRPRR